MPKVSVVIPNYNYAHYLPLRIESILSQTFQDFEIIILDDCSTDNSMLVIDGYRTNPKVSQVVCNKANTGSPFCQWDKGIELAKGEWVWIAEADDLSDRHFLEKLVTAAEMHSNTAVAYCQSNRMDSEGKVTGDWLNWTDSLDKTLFRSDFSMNGIEYIERFLVFRNTIPNASAAIFRKNHYLQAAKVDPAISFCADWHLWLKMLLCGDIAYSHEKLNFFRYHGKSVIAGSRKGGVEFKHAYDIKLRISFIHFIKNNHTNLKANAVLRASKGLLEDECLHEAVLVARQRKLLKASCYVFAIIRYGAVKQKAFLASFRICKAFIRSFVHA